MASSPSNETQNGSDRDSKQLLNTNRTIIIIVVAILLYSIILLYSDVDEIIGSLSFIPLSTILLVLLLTLLNYVLRYVKWRMGSFNCGIDVPRDILVYISGFIFSLTPSKIGEIARAWLLKEQAPKCKLSYGITLSIVDRTSDLLALTFLSLLTSAIMFQSVDQIIWGLTIVLLFLTSLLFSQQFSSLTVKLSAKLSAKVSGALENVFSSLQSYGVKKFAIAVILSIVSWSFEGLGLYIILKQLGAQVEVFTGIFIFSVGTIIGALSFLPGGLVTAELSMIGLTISTTSLNFSLAAVSTFIIRFATLWFGVLLGFVCYLLLKLRTST